MGDWLVRVSVRELDGIWDDAAECLRLCCSRQLTGAARRLEADDDREFKAAPAPSPLRGGMLQKVMCGAYTRSSQHVAEG